MCTDEWGSKRVLDSQFSTLDLKGIGRHLSRPKSQRGELSEHMPKRGKLARGRYWARWRIYFRQPDGRETVKRAEKIIDRDVAEQMGFTLDYAGPLTKTDARNVLEKLIRESNAMPAAFTSKATFGDLAREYIELSKPNWGANTVRSSENLIETHLITRLGPRPVKELTDAEMQRFLNEYVEKGSSVSLLSKLTLYLRAILETAVDQRLIDRNPARKLRAKSRKRASSLSHTSAECGALLAVVSGRDRLAIRILAQLGLRPEELCALRRNDARQTELMIDEAVVNGQTKEPKTLASASAVFVPPDLAIEIQHYLETIDSNPTAWLFPSTQKSVPMRPGNFLRRVLKPAAIRAGIEITKGIDGKITTALNFQSLRRTSSTLFGARAKDPKLTQAHMRHTDPQVTLKHYQQAIPSAVKAAAIALESELIEQLQKRESELQAEAASVRVV
jgi:integrase